MGPFVDHVKLKGKQEKQEQLKRDWKDLGKLAWTCLKIWDSCELGASLRGGIKLSFLELTIWAKF